MYYQTISELVYNITILSNKKLLNYLKSYYQDDKFNTQIILWDEKFSEIENLKFLYSLKKCVKGLFPDLRLKFIDNNILNDMSTYGYSKIKLDYTISFDVNIVSYILYQNTNNKCFKEAFIQVKENNWDFNPYIFENYLKFGDSFFTNEYIYKNIFELIKFIHPDKGKGFWLIELDRLYRNIKSHESSFQEFKDNLLRLQIFIMGLIYANFHFSKKEEKIEYMMELFDSKIGQFMLREFIYAIKFFNKEKPVFNFFSQKTQTNISESKLIKNIENLAYDLLLIRNLEYFSSLKKVRQNIQVDAYIPFLFSGDKELLKLLDSVKIKALIITEYENIKKITPVYFEDLESLLDKNFINKYFQKDAVINRTKRNIDLEKNLEEMKKVLLNEISITKNEDTNV